MIAIPWTVSSYELSGISRVLKVDPWANVATLQLVSLKNQQVA